MTKYREILRLSGLGLSQQSIADSQFHLFMKTAILKMPSLGSRIQKMEIEYIRNWSSTEIWRPNMD